MSGKFDGPNDRMYRDLTCDVCRAYDAVNVIGNSCEFCKLNPPGIDPVKRHINATANATVRVINRFRELDSLPH
jgi:hypothetical protein